MPYLYKPLVHQNFLLALRDCSFPGVLIRAWLIDIRWPHVECKKTKQNNNKNTNKFYLTITSLNGSEKIIIILTTSNNLQEPQHIKEEKKNRTKFYLTITSLNGSEKNHYNPYNQ